MFVEVIEVIEVIQVIQVIQVMGQWVTAGTRMPVCASRTEKRY
jgi:hypothetical protein